MDNLNHFQMGTLDDGVIGQSPRLPPMENKMGAPAAAAAAAFSSQSMEKNKLCIKIRIPNNNITNEAAVPGAAVVKEGGSGEVQLHRRDGARVCDICGKKFPNGKAWGGHKRHHLKVMRESMKLKEKAASLKLKGSGLQLKNIGCKTIKAGDVSMSEAGRPICCLCGKDFPTMNSLFGHMRFHPDRGWKGTQPPPLLSDCGSSVSEPAGLEVDQICPATESGLPSCVDLLKSMLCWSKKAKRGRVSPVDPIPDPIPEAAQCLLNLSRDFAGMNKLKSSSTPPAASEAKKLSLKVSAEARESAIKPIDAKIALLNKMDSRKGKAAMEAESNEKNVPFDDIKWGDADYPSGHSNKKFEELVEIGDLGRKICKDVREKKRKKMMKLSKFSNSENAEGIGSRELTTKKIFRDKSHRNFQALGASLSPRKNESIDMMCISTFILDTGAVATTTAAEADEGGRCEDGSRPAEISFQCDICKRTFPTGQALGGHKRCHWKSPLKAQSSVDVVASTGEASQIASNSATSEEASQAGVEAMEARHGMLGIDLNEPYVMQDGEDMSFTP